MSNDFSDMLSALSETRAEYLVVGAYALAAHGIVRGTLDFDIWVRPTPENASRVWDALIRFGTPLHAVTRSDFETPGIVFQIGVVPNRIDMLTEVSGVVFERAWANKIESVVFGHTVFVIGRYDLIENKRATGRDKDLLDVASLENQDKS